MAAQTEVLGIQLLPNGIVQLQTQTVAVVDGQTLKGQIHCASFTPGQSLEGMPDDFVAVCQAHWTPERVAAYQASQ